jgi:hypothetical protein
LIGGYMALKKGRVLLLGVMVSILTASYAQEPLGDVARKQREKLKTSSAPQAPQKVITDDDMPEHPLAADESSSATKDVSSEPASPSISKEASAQMVKNAILAQKNVIKNLQVQCDRLSDSIHYVQANLYTNGTEYNRYQQQKQQQLDGLRKQLDREKKKLEDAQEAARKAGFGNSVYDP